MLPLSLHPGPARLARFPPRFGGCWPRYQIWASALGQLLRATAAVGPARMREQRTNGVRLLSVDFQEIQYHRQKTFRVVDVYGMARVGYHDRLWEAAAFPHFTIEESIALGTSLSGEK